MKILIASFVSFFVILSCSSPALYQLPNGAYRPRHPGFDMEALTNDFHINPLIDTKHIYFKTRRYPLGNDNVLHYMGFYSDGRLMLGSLLESEMEQRISMENSFETSDYIGYYTNQSDYIHIEYFIPKEGVVYLQREGIVKKDTIILIDFERHFRIDTLIRSGYEKH